MKTNFHGLALAAALVSSTTLTANPAREVSFLFPGDVAGIGDSILYTPAHPDLDLEERRPLLPCRQVHPSLAGDLCEVGGKVASHQGERQRVAEDLIDPQPADGDSEGGMTTPEPGTTFLAALTGILFLFLCRRRTI